MCNASLWNVLVKELYIMHIREETDLSLSSIQTQFLHKFLHSDLELFFHETENFIYSHVEKIQITYMKCM